MQLKKQKKMVRLYLGLCLKNTWLGLRNSSWCGLKYLLWLPRSRIDDGPVATKTAGNRGQQLVKRNYKLLTQRRIDNPRCPQTYPMVGFELQSAVRQLC